MSVQALSWAFSIDAPNSSMKLVLLCLANYANRDGTAYPGQKSIAKESGLSLRTVNACLKGLEKDGLIRRERRNRDDGTRTSDLYILCLDNVQPLHVDEIDNVQNTSRQHATIAHQYKPNGLSEPVSEPLERARSKPKRKTQIDPDQKPNEKQCVYGVEKGLEPDAFYDEWERFKNHHISHGNKFVDWNRAWYKWVTSPYGKVANEKSSNTGNGTVSFLERAKAKGIGQRKAESRDGGDFASENELALQGVRQIEGH